MFHARGQHHILDKQLRAPESTNSAEPVHSSVSDEDDAKRKGGSTDGLCEGVLN